MTRLRIDPELGSALVAAALIAGGAAPVAAADNALPEPQMAGAVQYVTGGVGQRESRAFLEHRREYPLAVEVYAREAGREIYTAGASIEVKTPSGDTVLHAEADGPFLLADVPPGRYTVEATLDGKSQRKSVTVEEDRTRRTVFVFADVRA
jgi:hypothetical protein